MASATRRTLQEPVAAVLLLLAYLPSLHSSSSCGYSAIFSFGDSWADTGNRAAAAPIHAPFLCARPPYGMTYIRRPTGRCSNGRLIIDFIAQAMGLPLLAPFRRGWKGDADFRKGVNFAVAGGTAIEYSFLAENGVNVAPNSSLGLQIDWFKSVLPSLCPSDEPCELVTKSLFMVGEIGGNDVQKSFVAGKSAEEVMNFFVPKIISTISSAIQDLIDLGARTLLVPGNIAIGCETMFRQQFLNTTKPEDLDPETGCIVWLNSFGTAFNQRLVDELVRLRKLNPGAAIVYVDYYGAAMPMFRSPHKYGFIDTLDACCINHNMTAESSPLCGNPGTSSCVDPSTYVNWDGPHFTEVAYRAMWDGILRGKFLSPALPNLLCSKSSTTSDTRSILVASQ